SFRWFEVLTSYLGAKNRLNYVPFCTRRNENGSPLYCSLVKFAILVFFNTQRTLSRPSWTPVCWANTVASSRQLHWEERAPCWRGSWSTRRLRCCSNAQVILGGRPERGRSTSPRVPSVATRWTHLRSAD